MIPEEEDFISFAADMKTFVDGDIPRTLLNLIYLIADNEPDPYFLNLLKNLKRTFESDNSMVYILDLALMWLWDRLHDVHWKNVSQTYRLAFGVLSSVKVMSMISSQSCYDSLYRVIDIGILLGSSETLPYLTEMGRLLQDQDGSGNKKQSNHQGTWKISNLPHTIPSTSLHLRTSIAILDCPDMVRFYSDYFLSGRPVLIKHGADDWRALEQWKDLHYIRAGSSNNVNM